MFGCDVSGEEYGERRKIPVVRGARNIWVLARRGGSSADVEGFIKDALKPLDTAPFYMPSNVPYGIVGIDSVPQGVELLKRLGVTLQQKLVDVQPVPNLGANENLALFVLSFEVPPDAPAQVPWPVEGCVEDAQITVIYVMTSLPPITGPKAMETSEKLAVDRANRDALLAIQTAGKLGSEGSNVKSGAARSVLPLVIVAGAFGAFLFWRGKGARLLRQR